VPANQTSGINQSSKPFLRKETRRGTIRSRGAISTGTDELLGLSKKKRNLATWRKHHTEEEEERQLSRTVVAGKSADHAAQRFQPTAGAGELTSEVSACIGRQAEGRRRLSPVTARSPASLAAGLCWLALYWRASLVVGAPGCRISWYFYSVEL
jgi:hypothetical protein